MNKVDFEFQTIHGTFRDSIVYTEQENLSDEQIESIKQERLNNWLTLFNVDQVDRE